MGTPVCLQAWSYCPVQAQPTCWQSPAECEVMGYPDTHELRDFLKLCECYLVSSAGSANLRAGSGEM